MKHKVSASFFEKKEAKKLLSCGLGFLQGQSKQGVDARLRGHDGARAWAENCQKSFAELFFRKATAYSNIGDQYARH